MHAGFFDVLQDATDDDFFPITYRVDVDFDGIFQVFVEQHGCASGDFKSRADELRQLILIGYDLHRAAAEHEARTHHHGIADARSFAEGLVHGAGDAVHRLLQLDVLKDLLEQFTVAGAIDVGRTGADDRHAGFFER